MKQIFIGALAAIVAFAMGHEVGANKYKKAFELAESWFVTAADEVANLQDDYYDFQKYNAQMKALGFEGIKPADKIWNEAETNN